ncbi:MAG: hypothetical protein PWP52_368 [Bacteroidales bacterium]|nr:hypothetical protein [Bacteroidales bacterium]
MLEERQRQAVITKGASSPFILQMQGEEYLYCKIWGKNEAKMNENRGLGVLPLVYGLDCFLYLN